MLGSEGFLTEAAPWTADAQMQMCQNQSSKEEDMWNMDEKGITLGTAKHTKVGMRWQAPTSSYSRWCPRTHYCDRML